MQTKEKEAKRFNIFERKRNMSITIINPQEDMHGNKKENIFLALDGNNQYIAHSYIWPYENHHTCYEKPRNIFICLDVPLENECEVWERNKRAIRFYSRNGFVLTGEKPEEYPGIDVE